MKFQIEIYTICLLFRFNHKLFKNLFIHTVIEQILSIKYSVLIMKSI